MGLSLIQCNALPAEYGTSDPHQTFIDSCAPLCRFPCSRLLPPLWTTVCVCLCMCVWTKSSALVAWFLFARSLVQPLQNGLSVALIGMISYRINIHEHTRRHKHRRRSIAQLYVLHTPYSKCLASSVFNVHKYYLYLSLFWHLPITYWYVL